MKDQTEPDRPTERGAADRTRRQGTQKKASARRLTVDDVLAEVRRLGLRTPAEAVDMIRADRDR